MPANNPPRFTCPYASSFFAGKPRSYGRTIHRGLPVPPCHRSSRASRIAARSLLQVRQQLKPQQDHYCQYDWAVTRVSRPNRSSRQNRETLRIASTKNRIAIRSFSDSSRYRSTSFNSSELSRRLRRPRPRQGKIHNISVMPCTFDMDDVPLYVKENFRYRIALLFFQPLPCTN